MGARIVIIAIVAATSIACASEVPDETRAAGIPAAGDTAAAHDTAARSPASTLSLDCDTLAATLLRTGATRSALAEAYGEPDSVEVTTEPNRHMPDATDSLFVVHYPGLAVTLRAPPSARDLVSAVTVADNRYLAYPSIGMGTREEAVVAALGEPHERTARDGMTVLTYACGEEVEQPVTFLVRDDVVVRIEASYYVD